MVRVALEGDDEEPEVPVSEPEAMQRAEAEGISTAEAMVAMRLEKGGGPKRAWVAGAYERKLALFVSARVDEAQFAEAWHTLPDDLPINKQPWWKVLVWRMYLAGCEAGRKRQER